MKPMIFVPPAQAEALYDTQDDPRDDPIFDDRLSLPPWRDDDGPEDPRETLKAVRRTPSFGPAR